MAQEQGRQLDVGRYCLHVADEGTGAPAVVCDAGLDTPGASNPAWTALAEAVATFTRVIRYDRAGLGRSDRAPRPRDAHALVRDLAALLKVAAVPPPYVLVGHSLGGMTLRLFAQRFPEKVAGMVLVDTSHEEVSARFDAAVPDAVRRAGWEQAQANHEGIDLRAYQEQYGSVGPLPDVPIVVISRGIAPDQEQAGEWPVEQTEPIWHELQRALVASAPQGRHVIAEQSGHDIVDAQPELIIEAVRSVVAQCR